IELEDRVAASARREPAVPEEVDHLTRMALAGHEEYVRDPGELQELQRVVDHRPAPDREQVLVRDARQLAETRGLAARADEAPRLHPQDAKRPRRRGGLGPPPLAPAPRSSGSSFPLVHTGYRTYRGDPDVRHGPERADDQEQEPFGVEGDEQQCPHAGD